MCRDVFHCLPSALHAEPAENVLPLLTCLEVEGLVQRTKAEHGRS